MKVRTDCVELSWLALDAWTWLGGPPVRVTTLFNSLLKLQGLRVVGLEFVEGELILHILPRHRRMTCPHCKRTRPATTKHSVNENRDWRHLGIWGHIVELRGPIRRFYCRKCKELVTELVPWARHASRFTKPFENTVGLMAQKADRTTVNEMFGIAWETVGSIAERLVNELHSEDRFKNLKRIGVDEISFRKRHRYLTVVTDHDTGDVIWAGEGKCSETLKGFFNSLDQDVLDAIEIVTMDMSKAYQKAVRETLPNAQMWRCTPSDMTSAFPFRVP